MLNVYCFSEVYLVTWEDQPHRQGAGVCARAVGIIGTCGLVRRALVLPESLLDLCFCLLRTATCEPWVCLHGGLDHRALAGWARVVKHWATW